MVEAQGGDPRVVDDASRLPRAQETALFRAEKKGFLASLTPSALGYGLIELGGGRTRLGDAVNPSVGFVLHATVGQAVSRGEPIAAVHAADGAGIQMGLETLRKAALIADDSNVVLAQLPLLLRTVGEEEV
jgi:pyrimidine-nucleoside phosphorylase